MKYFAIEEGFANAVLQYLAKKPFEEVHILVKGFQELISVEQYETNRRQVELDNKEALDIKPKTEA